MSAELRSIFRDTKRRMPSSRNSISGILSYILNKKCFTEWLQVGNPLLPCAAPMTERSLIVAGLLNVATSGKLYEYDLRKELNLAELLGTELHTRQENSNELSCITGKHLIYDKQQNGIPIMTAVESVGKGGTLEIRASNVAAKYLDGMNKVPRTGSVRVYKLQKKYDVPASMARRIDVEDVIFFSLGRFRVRGNVKIMAVQSSFSLGSKPRGERHHTSTLDPIDSEGDLFSLHFVLVRPSKISPIQTQIF
ncbi:hypothetical protein ARMGADRAFT_1066232 [Armillaria gallica]|uniref:Uncharacterized protein n=1 Tax=Armillaria gallica TaxID=47427 RepID=A0A2H3CUV9_ARMGA|nr:hypothetical protein ARMGADRAFT_1066232 [Armillaria gallica]